MPGGGADDVDVDRSSNLLDRCGAWIRRRLFAQHVRLERNHPGVGEQQRRVDRDQRRRLHHGVAAFGEEVEEDSANLVGVHESRRLARPGFHAL